MRRRCKSWFTAASALAYLGAAIPAGAQEAAQWDRSAPLEVIRIAGDRCQGLRGWDRQRCEDRRYRERREDERRERERRKDAKAKGIAIGVVGAVIGAAILGAAASKKKKEADPRADYCLSRYGNYEPATDSYRASDGRNYPCE